MMLLLNWNTSGSCFSESRARKKYSSVSVSASTAGDVLSNYLHYAAIEDSFVSECESKTLREISSLSTK